MFIFTTGIYNSNTSFDNILPTCDFNIISPQLEERHNLIDILLLIFELIGRYQLIGFW